MGNAALSTCCGHDEDEELDSRIDGKEYETNNRVTNSNSYDHRNLGITSSDCEHFLQELKGGIEVNIVLAVGHGLKAMIQFDIESKAIIIMRGDNRRLIELRSLTRILHTPEQLTRIETQASLDSRCAAILLITGTCITLRFYKEVDCKSFVSVIGTMLYQLAV